VIGPPTPLQKTNSPGSVSQGASTLEVRWIRPGALPSAAIERFSRFLCDVESREDRYLVGRRIQGLSLKIRGGVLLEAKAASADRGVLDVPGQARGRIQSWRKWSFPIPLAQEPEYSGQYWVRVRKVRRIGWFALTDGPTAARATLAADDEGTCAVELTALLKGEEHWWTLGFEAPGHSDRTRETIEGVAALVLSDPLPGGVELSAADSMSYSEWLRRSH